MNGLNYDLGVWNEKTEKCEDRPKATFGHVLTQPRTLHMDGLVQSAKCQ